ncbi:hypothetical protein IW140_002346 [Coemansia sp. RSA 1813]|nr:hypothetical protein EV178_002009 [Coemansia sp. RSA 1646]KAJ1771819.1 hypothetical protein LPJ74_001993 [Coemansia sp. RSA 1843]KAJ2090784.1 hypothetical protein IW138_002402 [Coemansia sp. RSA 986]KAJ2216032.1 hypothetical protein EV179_001683 [Coemansia sp. RSA 487]KAJ2570446.1 hypothetical protein IW140_002346 [Coemansia sp. RSA 1813]
MDELPAASSVQGHNDRRNSTSSQEESTGSELSDSMEVTNEACKETYDENADHQDSAWMYKHHPGATDAVLSCPACFTQICFVCQAHARFAGQFRALSVMHCELTEDVFAFGKKSGLLEPIDNSAMQPNGKNVFRAVVCSECGTKVGVMDQENVYHLFHVLTGS